MLNPDYFIYALTCPDTDKIKYVGLTTIGLERFRLHRKDIRPNKNGKLIKVKAWVKSLISKNKTFNYKILEVCENKEQLVKQEIYWINFYKHLGLLNHTEGGFMPTVKKYTYNEKLEISRKTKIAMNKPEIREKFLIANKNRKMPKNYKSWSESSKLSVSNSVYHTSKKIQIVDSNNIIYKSLQDCAKKLGVTKQAISRTLSGKQKTVKGITLTRMET